MRVSFGTKCVQVESSLDRSTFSTFVPLAGRAPERLPFGIGRQMELHILAFPVDQQDHIELVEGQQTHREAADAFVEPILLLRRCAVRQEPLHAA